MEKLQKSDCYGSLSYDSIGNIKLGLISSWALAFLLVLNNLVYQTEFQVNQFVLSSASLLLVLGIVFLYGRVSQFLIIFLLGLCFSYAFAIYFSDSSEAINRSISYFVVSSLFAFLLFYGYRVVIPKSIYYLFVVSYSFLAILILYLNDRGIVNPNWVALTLFYLFFLVYGKTSILFLGFGLCLSLFVFESRGTSVVFLVSILLAFSQNIIGERSTKILYFLVYFAFIFVLFYIIYLLSSGSDFIRQVILFFTERGLGGRDIALIQGYEDLVRSNFLGVGPASPGGYEDPVTGMGVHIHFGLLELMLKFSGVAFIGFVYVMIKLVKNSSKDEFPMIGGAMMTVFFYNGLAPSHLGLNIFLLLIISRIFRKPASTAWNL